MPNELSIGVSDWKLFGFKEPRHMVKAGDVIKARWGEDYMVTTVSFETIKGTVAGTFTLRTVKIKSLKADPVRKLQSTLGEF